LSLIFHLLLRPLLVAASMWRERCLPGGDDSHRSDGNVRRNLSAPRLQITPGRVDAGCWRRPLLQAGVFKVAGASGIAGGQA
jgi:hypothetical protein